MLASLPEIICSPSTGNSTQPKNSSDDLCPPPVDSENETKKSGFSNTLQSFFAALKLSVWYTVGDVYRRPRNCCIGMMTVILIVFFSGVVMFGVAKAPYVVMRLAELSSGEMDIVLTGGMKGEPTINYTEIQPRLLNVTCVRGVAPRWFARVSVERYEPPNAQESKKELSTRADLLIIDSDVEEEIGLGRAWPHRATGYGESHVQESILAFTQLRPNRGERIVISAPIELALPGIDIRKSLILPRPKIPKNRTNIPLTSALGEYYSAPDAQVPLTDIMVNLHANVVDSISQALGKYPSLLDNVIIMDYKYVMPAFWDSSCVYGPQSVTTTSGAIRSLFNESNKISRKANEMDMQSRAMLLAVLFRDRRKVYESQDRASALAERSEKVMRAVGIDYGGTVVFPVARAFEVYENFQAILSSTLIRTVIEIAILDGILLFTLLQTNAEERQYEMALMRTQGFEKMHIVVLLVSQSLAFVVPGLLISIALLVIFHIGMEYALALFTHAPAQPFDIPLSSFLFATVLGIILPFIATWLPVSHALGSSLRDAMNVYRQVQNEAKVVIMRLEEMGLSLWEIALGIFLTVFGFIVYYMIPYTFLFQEIQLFFVFLNIILSVFILGLCMIMYVLEPRAEAFFLWIMLWFNEKRLATLIEKNLEDHRRRNTKAFVMFLLSVTSVVASGVIMTILSHSAQSVLQLDGGADIAIRSNSFYAPLDEQGLNAVLETWRGKGVEEWAYRGFSLAHYPQVMTSTRVSSVIGVGGSMSIVPVSEKFLRVVYPDLVNEVARDVRHIYEKTPDGVTDVVSSMYKSPSIPVVQGKMRGVTTGFPLEQTRPRVPGKMSFIIPAIGPLSLRDQLGVDVGEGMFLSYKYNTEDGIVKTVFYIQVRALMKSMSGFPNMLSVPLRHSRKPILLPETVFKELLNPTRLDFGEVKNMNIPSTSVTRIMQQVLYLRLQKGISARNRTVLMNLLQAKSDLGRHTFVDTQMKLLEVQTVTVFMTYFFYFSSFVCISLCTLMMWVTFFANVQQNVWSIGVLRSIGFRESQIIRATLYEAFSVVFSAFSLGIFLGVTVGAALGLQLSSILVLPFQLPLPYTLIGILLGLVVISALAGSIVPYRTVSKKKISHILRAL